MKAINILWDTYGEDIELPDEIEIPSCVSKEDIDEISDYLSDITGFCHFGFELVN